MAFHYFLIHVHFLPIHFATVGSTHILAGQSKSASQLISAGIKKNTILLQKHDKIIVQEL